MNNIFTIIVSISLLCYLTSTQARTRFGEKLCKNEGFYCLKVRHGQSWFDLFPDEEEQDIVRRINRINIGLKGGVMLAVPNNLQNSTIYDHSPFPRYIESTGEKTIYVSQKQLAWGAYDRNGELLWWGPISSGADTCRGVSGNCHTPGGSYRMIRKQNIDCISSAFPRRADGFHGGAPMPYCMHFFRGYALHGAPVVPGYRASHGCVRLFIEDARWLNEEFIDVANKGVKGTRVIIEPI